VNTTEQIRNLNIKCQDSALFAGKLWSPQYFPNKFASFQHDIIRRIENRPKDVEIIVIECPRGAAKTLLISSLLSVHDGVYNNLKFTVIASNADDMAQRIVGDATNFIKSERFSKMFPGTHLVRDKKMLIEISNPDFGFEFQIMSRGRTSQATGLRYKENRIQRFIGDDLEAPEAAYSQELVDSNVRYVNEVIKPAMEPGGLIILIGTPFAFDCTTRRISDYPRGVMTIRYPILVDNQLGGIYMGKKKIGGDMSDMLGIEEGKSIWEDRFPTAWVENKRDVEFSAGRSAFAAFIRQYMLDPRSPGSIQFDMDKIKYIDPNEITKKLNIFILCDFAYSKQLWADESAIVVVGVDEDNNFYVLYAEKDRWGDVGTTEKIIEVAQRFKENLRMVGVETRSYGFVQKRIMEAKRSTNLNFGLTELKPGNRVKSERIAALIPLLDDGRLYMVRGLSKLEGEMFRFKGEEMKHGDDLMDSLAYILDATYKPVTIKTKEEMSKAENHRLWEEEFKRYDEAHKPRSIFEHDSYRNIDNFF